MVRISLIVACSAAAALAAGPAASRTPSDLASVVEAWLDAPHADFHSPAFTHWNAEGEVPERCAACHSETGIIDFLGADGSAPGRVDAPAAINAPVGCPACHTAEAHALDEVAFPSGDVIAEPGASAICMICHQGRASGGAVAAAMEGMAADAVSPGLAFSSIHYGPSAATLFGAATRGGYQYADRTYAGRFRHVPSADSCTSCHDPHSAEVATESCLTCHRGVEEIGDIRTRHADFDGDGDRAEGIGGEIATLHARLGDAIGLYAEQVAGAPIGYAGDAFPYFFNDSDGDGEINGGETAYANRYRNWTPRLLKAAYNFDFVAKDPAAWAHNPAYALQLLHDGIESLAQRASGDAKPMVRP